LRFFYNRNFSPNWLDINYLKKKGVNFRENRPGLIKKFKGQRVKESMLRSITGRGLPGLLRHSDRNSMAFSIENRVPFLTIPIANFVFSLPENFLISDKAVTKNIFRESMRGIVADKILDRKDKIGFASPTDKWLLENKVEIKNFLMKAKTPPFLNIKIILKEIKKNKFNINLWRKINYIYFYNFFFKKVNN
jgi:asparagine synthase (glutamine-hydrolysing)